MRHPLRLLSCLLAAAGLFAGAPPSLKRDPVEVLTLTDGNMALPATLLQGLEPAEVRRMLGGKDEAPTPVNAFLVRLHGRNILVDTGLGAAPGGHLGEQLRLAGVDPAQIDLVLITHFHRDHIGGLLKADGTRAFPKAVLRVARAEHDFWLGEPSSLPERLKPALPGLRAALAPYQSAGAYKPFGPDEPLGRGILAIPAPGHTGGHTVYAFGSEGWPVWCVGDLIHFSAIQFEHPGASVQFDADAATAVRSRRELFEHAARCGAVLAGAHLPQLVVLKPTVSQGFKAIPAR